MMVDPTAEASMRTLWMGDLAYWMDESLLYTLFANTGELISAKVIRNKLNGQSEGYGFLEFRTHEGAEAVLRTYNGQPMPNTDQVFRLNWAAFGVGKGNPEGDGPCFILCKAPRSQACSSSLTAPHTAADYSIFVGDLAPDVTDFLLQEHFRQFFPSVRSAKVRNLQCA
jgi:RNA recognition motif-containing protein